MTQREPSSLPLIASLVVATALHAIVLSSQWRSSPVKSAPAFIIADIVSASGHLNSQKTSLKSTTTETDSMAEDAGEVQNDAGQSSPLATANAVSASPAEPEEALDIKKSTSKPRDIVLSEQSDIKEEKLAEEQQEAPLPMNDTSANPDTGAKQSLSGQSQALSTPNKQLATDDYFNVAKTWLEKNRVDLRKVDDFSSGTALLKVTLKYGGVVTAVDVVKSSGHDLLDQSARQTVLSSSPFPSPPKEHFNKYEFSMSFFYDKEH